MHSTRPIGQGVNDMLVLSRKRNESITIGSDVVLTVLSIEGRRVKIGIEAPANVHIVRSELSPIALDFPLVRGARLEDGDSLECAPTATPSLPR